MHSCLVQGTEILAKDRTGQTFAMHEANGLEELNHIGSSLTLRVSPEAKYLVLQSAPIAHV